MNDKKFDDIISQLGEYLKADKTFVQNPVRAAEFLRANEILSTLFPDSVREIKNDPLQMGAMILQMEGSDIILRGQGDMALFREFTEYADNFEIYATENGNVRLAAVFSGVYKRVR